MRSESDFQLAIQCKASLPLYSHMAIGWPMSRHLTEHMWRKQWQQHMGESSLTDCSTGTDQTSWETNKFGMNDSSGLFCQEFPGFLGSSSTHHAHWNWHHKGEACQCRRLRCPRSWSQAVEQTSTRAVNNHKPPSSILQPGHLKCKHIQFTLKIQFILKKPKQPFSQFSPYGEVGRKN